MFIDKRHRGEDPWLNFKVGTFAAGAVLTVAGIYLESRWLIWVAIVVLVLGFATRFLKGGDAPRSEENSSEDGG